MNESSHDSTRIYVAGHRGLVGSAILRALETRGYKDLVTRSHSELDLVDQDATREFMKTERPDYVFMAAAKVGGILANDTYPADFIRQNLAIQTNLIHASWRHGVKKLLFLGSSCIYPRDCPQPIKEEYLLTGPLEKTNRAYAIAKIAGIEMCASYNRQFGTEYICAMPTNLYGPGDKYDLNSSHVLAALLRKAHEAKTRDGKELLVWGSGTPRREFLHVDDMADACILLMEQSTQLSRNSPLPTLINIGTGTDITVRELAEMIMRVVGLDVQLVFDTSKPDGTPRKLLDNSRMRMLGWQPKIELADGIASTYVDYLAGLPTSAGVPSSVAAD